MSCNLPKKLLKCTQSGLADINKQNTGWRARLAWIRNEPTVKGEFNGTRTDHQVPGREDSATS